ncbi:MAG TPA: hypothetical protein VHW09_13965 [Bryobacteraceae bacterium]|jgi:hypothetical protein|nr:hypothetical protein [Bryobacteraceae bacterium]
MPDLELESWRAEWQADREVPADLRRKIARGTRYMRLMLAAEVLVTVTIGGGSIVWAVLDPRTEMYVLALAVWIFLAAAWAFAIVTRRGTWSAAAPTTADYIDLSIRRCRGKLAAARFGLVLYFAEMAFCLTWLYRDPARRVPAPAVIFGVATPLFLAGLARYRRRTRAELARLKDLVS